MLCVQSPAQKKKKRGRKEGRKERRKEGNVYFQLPFMISSLTLPGLTCNFINECGSKGS
jgi:hypothetical protein